MAPLIVAFCRTNLALIEATQRLYEQASAASRVAEGCSSVRVIRCLTKCHSCGDVPYVRIGHDILVDPTAEQLRVALATLLDGRTETSP